MNFPSDRAAGGAAGFSHSMASAAPSWTARSTLTVDSALAVWEALADRLRVLKDQVVTSSFGSPVKDMLLARFERARERFSAGGRELSRLGGREDPAGLLRAVDLLEDASRRAIAISTLMGNDVPPYDLEQARLAEPFIAGALSRAGPRELDGVLELVRAYDASGAALHDEALLNLVVGFTALNIAVDTPAQAASSRRPRSAESPPRQMPMRKPMSDASTPLGAAAQAEAVATGRESPPPGDARAMAQSLEVWAHPIEEDFLTSVLLCVVDSPASKGCWLPAPLQAMTASAARRAQCLAQQPGQVRRDVLIETLRKVYADHAGLPEFGAPRGAHLSARPPQEQAEQVCFKEVTQAFIAGKKLPRYLNTYIARLLMRGV